MLSRRRTVALPRGRVWLTILLALPVSAEAADGNLLENGGFEEAESGWTLRASEVTDKEARTGKHALRVTPSVDETEPYSYQRARAHIQLRVGRFYRVDAWVKAKGAAEAKGKTLSLYTDAGGTTYSNPGDHGWEPVTQIFQAKKGGVTRVFVMCPKDVSGEFLVDDVAVRQIRDPSLKPATFEDGTMAGVTLSGKPLPIARVVKGSTPGGKHYLSVERGYAAFRLSRPIEDGNVEFSFLFKAVRRVTFELGGVGRLYLLPTINLGTGNSLGPALGVLSGDSWCRIRGIVRRRERTLDLTVTDFEDPLGSYDRKGVKLPNPIKSVGGMAFLNIVPSYTACLDDLYLGPVRQGN